jgi:hypothetical protein
MRRMGFPFGAMRFAYCTLLSLWRVGCVPRTISKGSAVNPEIDTAKIDQAVLALLYRTLHDGDRAWKSLDWDAMNRLHEQGLIGDPVGKAKSVVLTPAGKEQAERLYFQLFGK